MEPITPSRRSARARLKYWRAPFRRARVDIVAQDIVEEALTSSMNIRHRSNRPRFEVETRQAADRGAILTMMIAAGRQRDFRTEIRSRDLQAEVTMMLGHRPVHLVDEDDIGFTGGEPRLDKLLEQGTRIYLAALGSILRALQHPLAALADRLHEGVGDEHAMVEVERLSVEIARRLANSRNSSISG